MQAFVVSDKNGRWGQAIKVPGLVALNAGGTAHLVSVSCGSAGSCAADGYYLDAFRHFQAFVVSKRNGCWGQAMKVPGSGALNAGGSAATALRVSGARRPGSIVGAEKHVLDSQSMWLGTGQSRVLRSDPAAAVLPTKIKTRPLSLSIGPLTWYFWFWVKR